MFYLVRNLRTDLTFSAYDMDKLSNDKQILLRLKDKVQGCCHPEYGYIIQFVKSTSGNQAYGYDISTPTVNQSGCTITITFSAITFKVQKNDIIDIIVTQVQEQYIKGTIGHAEVLIPHTKMDKSCLYKKTENIFIIQDDSYDYRIQRGSKVRCKCFQVKTQMNFQMKMIASLDKQIIGVMQI